MATRPRRASWATFVAVHFVVQLQTAEMAILVWYTDLVYQTSSNHTFCVDSAFSRQEQISAEPLPVYIQCNQTFGTLPQHWCAEHSNGSKSWSMFDNAPHSN